MRTVVISGASSGIGFAAAEHFARSGDTVFNLDVQPPIAAPSPGVTWVEADVTDWPAIEAAVAAVWTDQGRLDVVIANAGISVRHGVLNLDEATARRVVDVNLLGVLGLWRCAAGYMTRQGRGVLLATASVNASRAYPYYADYNATKAGVLALCRTFALELSPNIRVACVSPGAVLTPMQEAEYTPEMLEEVNRSIPLGRHAQPSEIGAAFHYLASPAAAFLTGQELVVDGGEIAGATTSAFGTGGTTDVPGPAAWPLSSTLRAGDVTF
ncbi:SDR family oxidoreductase [Nonomuraea sp. NPDC049486]|jgi:NAD(P)-dependent dehydrogenase (short-subunit alcohol dehydrogenase family)|uniref:SDR family NAD(P)-dependent oxidoreductase n=1 Tax=Nonomuraea harbinensis TaxID=1286938 RepID=A0ABW1BP85_9ACTN|nr:SDR family oxidoreductase [Nonomuraea harbinensis]